MIDMIIRYLPFVILALVMLGFVLPLMVAIAIAAMTVLLFFIAYLVYNRHPLLFPPQKLWERYREEHKPDGIVKEEKVHVQLQTGVRFVDRRRYRALKRQLPGYLLLTGKWFLVFCGDMLVIYIPHTAPDPTFDLWVSIRDGNLILDAHRYGGTQFGHNVVKVFTPNAQEWIDLLAPAEN